MHIPCIILTKGIAMKRDSVSYPISTHSYYSILLKHILLFSFLECYQTQPITSQMLCEGGAQQESRSGLDCGRYSLQKEKAYKNVRLVWYKVHISC